MKNRVWLLMGLTGSTEGVLSFENNALSFEIYDKGALSAGQLKELSTQIGINDLAEQLERNETTTLFSIPVSSISKIEFPWFTFGGGMNVTLRGVKYRFSFMQPQNTVAAPRLAAGVIGIQNVAEGRKAGKQWKQLLTAG